MASNIGHQYLAQIPEISMNTSPTQSTTNSTNVPVKYQPTDTKILCVNDNTNNIHDIP